MIIKLATCLLALSCITACTTTSTTANGPRQSLERRMLASNASAAEPAPPAEGPEDVPAEGTVDPNRNPGLLPTPLLRGNAAGSL